MAPNRTVSAIYLVLISICANVIGTGAGTGDSSMLLAEAPGVPSDEPMEETW